MPSSLIHRIIHADEDQIALAVHAVCGFALDTLAGRPFEIGELGDMATIGTLTPAELADAQFVIGKITNGVYSIQEVHFWLLMGEYGTLTETEVHQRLGLVP